MTDIPVMGVIDSSVRTAMQQCRNGRIAVLATAATINSHAYASAIHAIAPELEVVEKACPLFVPLIENGYADQNNPVTRMVAADYLSDLIRFDPDTVILGCTHYPIIKAIIHSFLPKAYLVESGKEAARELTACLSSSGMVSTAKEKGRLTFYLSEETESFSQVGELFLGQSVYGKICKESADHYQP
jgi:glutamate racemase